MVCVALEFFMSRFPNYLMYLTVHYACTLQPCKDTDLHMDNILHGI